MKTVLPGGSIGLFGEGENSRMFAAVAECMGYRIKVCSSPWEDLDRIRQFAASVDVIAATDSSVPLVAIQAAAQRTDVHPSPSVIEAIENGVGAKRDFPAAPLMEVSIIGARAINGDSVFYQPIAIDRIDGRLDIARTPAPIDSRMAKRAMRLTRDMLDDLKLTGIACVELILTQDQELLVQEVTPHPHNSGHLTLNACVTSQFEQQLRAVCGLPFGSTEMLRPAAMATLSETVWQPGEPDWPAAYSFPEVKVHLYGARRGHLSATAPSATRAKQTVAAARASLTRKYTT